MPALPPPRPSPAGHRLVAHTADMVLEAWAPTRARCMEEAVRALVAAFADTGGAVPQGDVPLRTRAAPDADVLVDALEEVVYVLDVHGAVPVDVALRDEPDGSLTGRLVVADVHHVQAVGAAPKAVARHELALARDHDGWWCRVMVDV